MAVAGLEGLVEGCGSYLVFTGVVRQDRVLIRFVRAVEGLGGRVLHVDEEARSVRANVPAGRIGLLSELAEAYLAGHSVEVKASCRSGDPGRLIESLKGAGCRILAGPGGRYTAYGLTPSGRIVEVEVDRASGRVKLKIGRRLTGKPRSAPPPGLFLLTLEEAREALGELASLVGRR